MTSDYEFMNILIHINGILPHGLFNALFMPTIGIPIADLSFLGSLNEHQQYL